MREIVSDLIRWRKRGMGEIALATIVETRGSSLRPAGARMALSKSGEIAGSVSGGCVDGDVVAEMEAVLNRDVEIRRPSFGISDEQAWESGLSCGGALDLIVERWDPLYDVMIREIEARQPVGFASRTDRPIHRLRKADGTTLGSLGSAALDDRVVADMMDVWPGPHAEKHRYPEGEVFVEVVPPPLNLFVFGATDIARHLASMARLMDFEVVVSDARRAFLNEARFPKVERRLGWPEKVATPQDLGPGSAVVVLFHDQKLDVPALTLALRSDAFYIGLLGSRRTQADRRQALLDAGFEAGDLARIHGPVGLDIGGKAPSMIALSALSEIVAVRHRKAGGMMNRADS